MDTSKEYIKMCRKAIGVQEQKFQDGFTEGDYIFDGDNVHVVGFDWICIKNYFPKYPEVHFAVIEDMSVSFAQEYLMGEIRAKSGKYTIRRIAGIGIWLPRQDQLQEMVAGSDHPLLLLDKFHDWTLSMGYDLKSFEQYWLAFVMKKKYGKTWNWEEWMKGETK